MAITLGLVINLQLIEFLYYAATKTKLCVAFFFFFITFCFLLCFTFLYFLSLFATFARFLAPRISVSFSVCDVFVVAVVHFRDKFKLVSFGD